MSSHYPPEFKQKAVELVTTQRKSIAQVSRELNVAKPTLYYWLNNQSSGSRASASGRPTMDPAQENKRLRAHNAAMKKELDALRAEHEDIKEENRAAKLVIEYFRTHNPPKA
jgi:transposase-like protein